MPLWLTMATWALWRRPRQRHFHMARMGFVLLGAAVVLGTAGIGLAEQSTVLGLYLFRSLAYTMLLTTILASALVPGFGLIREKTERTLGLLHMTELTAGSQVVGWYCSGVFQRVALEERMPGPARVRAGFSLLPRTTGRAVPALEGNPVAWKDENYRYGGRRHEWAICLALAAVGGVIGGIVGLLMDEGPAVTVTGCLAGAGGTSALVMGLAPVIRAAGAFSQETADHTLELLFLTDLWDREIVDGKIRAIWMTSLPWAVVLAVCLLAAEIPWMMSGGRYASILWFPFVMAFGEFVVVWAFVMLGLWLSLRFRPTTALVVSLGLFLLSIGCCQLWVMLLPAAIAFRHLLYRDFRQGVLRRG